MFLKDFYKGKKVLVTGHTGFKGSWLVKILNEFGAEVCGYSLSPSTTPSLYEIINGDTLCKSVIGDISDYDKLKKVFDDFKPQIVLHLAAQPLVLEGYAKPVYTYQTNVMGTVNLLECVRFTDSVKSVVNVTTDKVYKNVEKNEGYREDEYLCGYDPYSNSKSCSDILTFSYKKSYLESKGISVSVVRAGNVIGGGDFSANRIIPDCVKAAAENRKILVRNPYSVRPYQHVLEPLFTYLYIAMKQYEDMQFSGCFNVGPDVTDCVRTGELVKTFCRLWADSINYEIKEIENAPHEAGLLMLDNSKIKRVFSIYPVWNVETAIAKTIDWSKSYFKNGTVNEVMQEQIATFSALFEKVVIK
ncbi:MAG: CDP-glucose 4,6-dehydratase [Clostridiales bacterium]|nr:CDP-glucose 4,6-dehydratase [Clostridiales bacterium]